MFAPDATSRAQCVYVYMFAPDAASRDMCCCDVMPLMPIPGLTNVHNPDATSNVLCVYVYVLCVCAPDATSRAMFRCSHPWSMARTECINSWGEWPIRYFPQPPSSRVGFRRSRHIKGSLNDSLKYMATPPSSFVALPHAIDALS